MMKQAHPEWGCERIREVLLRGEGYSASPGAIAHLLRENGYELEDVETSPHPPAVQHFERARPNQLWQTDLFTFLLKRENRRVYLVVYLDDHSRFIVGYGVWASAGGALVREVLEAAIANFGAPEEVLTDNGPQYVTWRGTSAFAKLLERRGIRHLVARPRRPQTLGKTERFWGTLWRECVEAAVFGGVDDARRRVGHFIDHYNFQRPHQGIDGLVPADRYFAAAPQVRETLQARVAANAADLAIQGTPRKSFYLTGRVGDTDLALHSEGSRVVLTRSDGAREEVDLEAPGRRAMESEASTMPEPIAATAVESATALEPEGTDPDPGDAP
jgi:transposase InsO family protein